jgi:surface polysaccharide O-acyltransferase-like enzyme
MDRILGFILLVIFIALLFNSPYLETLPMVKCLLTVVISLFASLLLSVLISKIPYLSKVILK